jgi:hypothetical protein
MSVAETVLVLVGAYAGLGVAAALVVVLLGLERVDRNATGSTWGFKLLVFPGIAALWPFVLVRWIRATGVPPEERNAHRCAAKATGGGES